MIMYVYADILFIINIIMNSTILLLTAITTGVNYNLWRILFVATIGSGYVLVSMLPSMMIIQQPVYKILISVLLVLSAFGLQPRRKLLLLMTFFYVIAFTLGGAVAGWLYFWQTSNDFGSCEIVMKNLSWENLLWGSLLGVFLIMTVLRRLLSRATLEQNLYQIRLIYKGQMIELTAMLDTGNGLYTVVGHKPVIIVNQHAIESIVSQQVVEFLQNNTPSSWIANLEKCEDLEWISRIQVIPYHGIGSESMLLAFRMDHIVVWSKHDSIDVTDAVIAIYSGFLSGDRAYNALLHPQIVNELSKKEEVGICV